MHPAKFHYPPRKPHGADTGGAQGLPGYHGEPEGSLK